MYDFYRGSMSLAGWMKKTTGAGRVYYINQMTKTTSWDRPVAPPVTHASRPQCADPLPPPSFAKVVSIPAPIRTTTKTNGDDRDSPLPDGERSRFLFRWSISDF